MIEKLERFLSQFPDNATSWSQATDELPEMYHWISDGGRRFPSVGKINCVSPADWNQKYKAAIRRTIVLLTDEQREAFAKRFALWLR